MKALRKLGNQTNVGSLALATTLAIISCSSLTHQKWTTSGWQSHVSVVGLAVEEATGKVVTTRTGAGVVFSVSEGKMYAVTAGHVVEGKQFEASGIKAEIEVIIEEDGESYPAKIEERRPNGLDLTIVSFDNPGGTKAPSAASLAGQDPEGGTRVSIFGSPDCSFRSTLHRRISRRCAPEDCNRFCHLRRHHCLLLDEKVVPGYSGGGMYDPSGDLAGICVGFQRNKSQNGICIAISALRETLNRYIQRP